MLVVAPEIEFSKALIDIDVWSTRFLLIEDI